MQIEISHTTTYKYDQPVNYGLQRIRLDPQSNSGQSVKDWSVQVEGGTEQVRYRDHHDNDTRLILLDPDCTNLTITSKGVVDVTSTDGVLGTHVGCAPLWLYLAQTDLTKPGPAIRKLAKSVEDQGDLLSWLHALSAAVAKAVVYQTGTTEVTTLGEEALIAGKGVCQDHAHILISIARLNDLPARYVSGYLLMDGIIEQEAGHGWAEVYVDNLGWVGFDVSNGVAPDGRYVRLATGLDYADAAPIHGLRMGHGKEDLTVALQVQQ